MVYLFILFFAYGLAFWLFRGMDKQDVNYEKNLPVVRKHFNSKEICQ